ncbi:MAG: hypothetical protein KF696_15750 [Planctomycetes bacterium]|nr:hypothetical protein [Planctomycetota bacterium]MCW8136238.1 hypothetical protein [Planctomycetota bacterium]
MSTPSQPETPLRKAYGRYMFVVGIGGNLLFYIQAFEIFTSQQARDVSLWAFVIAFWAVASWFVYGLVLRNWVLISANVVAMIGSALVVAGKLLYGY